MRARFALTLVAVLLVGVAAKVMLFPQPAEAVPSVSSLSLDIEKMQAGITNLPVQKFHDMTFVFDEQEQGAQ
jgi:predicted acyltransferase